MTNTEAAEIIQALIFILKNEDYSNEVEEAIHMAINALKAQDLNKQVTGKLNFADDTISKKEALDWLKNEWNGMVMSLFDGIKALPSSQPGIIYCKDCVKHNKGHGYYLDGTFIGIKDCCPLIEIRGMAQGHEFDYQYCAYAERRTGDTD